MKKLINELKEQLLKIENAHSKEMNSNTYWRGVKIGLETAIENAETILSGKCSKIKCLRTGVNLQTNEHVLYLSQNENNTGLFGSKVEEAQFEKIESVLNKRYFKLPFGIRIVL